MASKRALRRASCIRKVRHESPALARQQALRLREENGSRAYGFYRCQFCGGWHVGRRNKRLIRSAISHASNKRLRDRFKHMLKEE